LEVVGGGQSITVVDGGGIPHLSGGIITTIKVKPSLPDVKKRIEN
jgi:hypothetical protein